MLNHCGTIELKTERLLLRRLDSGDEAAVLANWGADEEVFCFMTSSIMKTARDVRVFLRQKAEQYKRKDFYYWAIVPDCVGMPVGMVTFTEIGSRKKTANLAYALGRAWWGKGYAKEASLRAMELMFDVVGLKTVTGSHFEGNDRSGHTLLSLGMRHLGRSRMSYPCGERMLRCDDYEIKIDEFHSSILG